MVVAWHSREHGTSRARCNNLISLRSFSFSLKAVSFSWQLIHELAANAIGIKAARIMIMANMTFFGLNIDSPFSTFKI